VIIKIISAIENHSEANIWMIRVLFHTELITTIRTDALATIFAVVYELQSRELFNHEHISQTVYKNKLTVKA